MAIIGKRINLRKLVTSDISVVSEWLSNSDYNYFLEGSPLDSMYEVVMYINQLIEENRSTKECCNTLSFLIVNKKDIPVGLVMLFQIDWRNRNCKINIFLTPNGKRGSIYGAEAIWKVVTYAFDELNMHKICGHIHEFNKKSIQIFEKMGAKREAVLRNYVIRDGQLQNTFVYGFLESEYKKQNFVF